MAMVAAVVVIPQKTATYIFDEWPLQALKPINTLVYGIQDSSAAAHDAVLEGSRDLRVAT